MNTQSVKGERTNRLLVVIPSFLTLACNYAVLVLGVRLTMEGKFTLGAVLMFQGFLSAFMSPAMTLIGAGQTLQEMRTEMERVEDVMEYRDDPVVTMGADPETAELEKLRGNVELKDVTFGYSYHALL